VIISIIIFVSLSDILSVLLDVRIKELGFHWKDCHEIWQRKLKKKIVEKGKVSLQSDKKNFYFNNEVCTL